MNQYVSVGHRETAKHAVGVQRSGKVGEIHIGLPKVILRPPGLCGNHPECATRLFFQIDDQYRMSRVCNGFGIDHEHKAPLMIWRQDALHILGWDSGISLVIDALDIGDEAEFWIRRLDAFADLLPGGIVRKIRSDQQRIVVFR